MKYKKEVKESFSRTLEEISKKAGFSFSGIGLLLYETGVFSGEYHSDLRPSFSRPKGIVLGKKETIETLLRISDKSNPLHDGFIFFNEKGEMTHVSQYFSPLVIGKRIIPNENYGTRYRAAQYGSLLEGVILTGTVNSDHRYHIFHKGRHLELLSEISEL